MRLVLLRHGESEGNVGRLYSGQLDSPLTPKGREQALQTGVYINKMMDIEFDAIYASALSRAFDTASIVVDQLSAEHTILTDNRLNERDIGRLSGMKRRQLILHPRFYGDIESTKSVSDRFQSAIDDIYLAYPTGNVMIVAHQGSIQYRLSSQGCPTPRRLTNASITQVEYTESSCSVVDYGISEHIRS